MNFIPRLVHGLNLARLWLTRPLTLGVRVILIHGGQVALVQHTYHPGWVLPGGGVDKGETLEAAARREAREELCAELGELRLMGVYTNFYEYKSDHVAVFVCENFRLEPFRPSWEIQCMQFFPLRDLPEDLMPGHRRRVEELLRGASQPGFGMW